MARSYGLVGGWDGKGRGWTASYPETTGYIIPTLLAYHRQSGERAIRERALRMADWECRIQMANGAIQGGTVDAPPAPATFNTGQVIFGWLDAFRETGDKRYLRAAGRAADFLVEVQDSDGAWRRFRSRFVSRKVRESLGAYAYEARTAWALLEVWKQTRSETYRNAAEKNLEHCLSLQSQSGWFAQSCIQDPERPLLHTIAYAAEGFLESGLLLDRGVYVAAARRTADALIRLQRHDGSLAGRFDACWAPASRWSCLTGDAQIARVWLRLHALAGSGAYLNAARKMNRFLKLTQDLTSEDPGVRGGLSGSYPIGGGYAPFEYVSWAAKFFVDSLLLERECAAVGGEIPC